MKKFTVIARPDPVSEQLKQRAIADLTGNGYVYDPDWPDYCFVIGGDGTFIYAVHDILRKHKKNLDKVLFYGIHTGTLGFYTDYLDTEYDEFIDTFLKGEYKITDYPLLQVEYETHKHNAINEIRVENSARTQLIDVYVNGEKFETFRGTGLCVCTQLGSTAYNRSLGGAVMQEGLDFIELTEMAGIHHSKYRSLEAPIILKGDTVLEFRSPTFKDAIIGCDADVYRIDEVTSITIHICETASVHMIRGRQVSYFDRLKSLF
jgi:NAD+ kinase